MSRFGPDPRASFDMMYSQPAPWDVGAPQPGLVELFDEFAPAGPVLDVGCGTGDLAIALARRGLEVVGVDFVEAAIIEAWRRAESLPPEDAARLTFEVGDATKPSALGRRFGAVVDSGFLHVLDAGQRDAFVAELANTLTPGGRYYLQAFAVEYDVPNTPLRVTEEELRARFSEAAGWRIVALRSTGFVNRVAPPVPAVAACIECLASDEA